MQSILHVSALCSTLCSLGLAAHGALSRLGSRVSRDAAGQHTAGAAHATQHHIRRSFIVRSTECTGREAGAHAHTKREIRKLHVARVLRRRLPGAEAARMAWWSCASASSGPNELGRNTLTRGLRRRLACPPACMSVRVVACAAPSTPVTVSPINSTTPDGASAGGCGTKRVLSTAISARSDASCGGNAAICSLTMTFVPPSRSLTCVGLEWIQLDAPTSHQPLNHTPATAPCGSRNERSSSHYSTIMAPSWHSFVDLRAIHTTPASPPAAAHASPGHRGAAASAGAQTAALPRRHGHRAPPASRRRLQRPQSGMARNRLQ